MRYPEKENWNPNKVHTYKENILAQLRSTGDCNYKGASVLMVKSGEIYTSEEFNLVDGFLEG